MQNSQHLGLDNLINISVLVTAKEDDRLPIHYHVQFNLNRLTDPTARLAG